MEMHTCLCVFCLYVCVCVTSGHLRRSWGHAFLEDALRLRLTLVQALLRCRQEEQALEAEAVLDATVRLESETKTSLLLASCYCFLDHAVGRGSVFVVGKFVGKCVVHV